MKHELNKINKTTNNRLSKYNAFFNSVYGILNNSLPFIVIIIGSYLIKNNQLSIGKLVAIITLVGFLQEPVLVIPEFINERNRALALSKRVDPFLVEDVCTYSVENPGTFKTLSFSSNGMKINKNRTILKNIKFNIRCGENVIIEGESGKGKSTIFSCISNFLQDDNIKVEYNGIGINNINSYRYYDRILSVSQFPVMFQTSLLDNIIMGETFSEKKINDILRVTCLSELFNEKGKTFEITEEGDNLSGGEIQRIGIARMLIKDPDVIMLDEPTSALNWEISNELIKNIINYCHDNKITIVIITHSEEIKKKYAEYFKIVTI